MCIRDRFGNEDGEMVLPTSLRSTEAKDGAVTFEGPTEEKLSLIHISEPTRPY